MNLSPQWCERLQRAGVEALHWSSIGAVNAPDEILFVWAAENCAVILTQDLGFAGIHALARSTGPSIVQIRSAEVAPAIIGDVIVRVLNEHQQALSDGAIVSVDLKGARVRRLPLGRR